MQFACTGIVDNDYTSLINIRKINSVFLMFVFNYSNIFSECSAHVTLLYMQDNDSCAPKNNLIALRS